MPQLRPQRRLPMPPVTELDLLPHGFFGDARRLPALVPAGHMDRVQLLRFQALMAFAGEPVALHRMRYDRRYALERIACAHAQPGRSLRRLALELFDALDAARWS